MIVHNTDEALIYQGDCLDVLRTFPANVVDTVITDPPYGLEFMGKGWDKGVPGPAYWAEALRVIKPGGTLLAFGGTRTYHRLACAIEDAGWEIVDCIMWLYGSGFPKSLDISKAIDKAAGVEREVVGQGPNANRRPNPIRTGSTFSDDTCVWGQGDPITAPATPAAQLWNGYGTALKPAWEPIIMARAPREGTYAANALAWGVAGLNVDGARIPAAAGDREDYGLDNGAPAGMGYGGRGGGRTPYRRPADGRWPANLILDEAAGALLDEQSGERGGGAGQSTRGQRTKGEGWASIPKNVNTWKGQRENIGYRDKGGASRFFYCAKASKAEQNAVQGRWPANLILDEAAGALLDEQSGIKPSRWGKAPESDDPRDENRSSYGKGIKGGTPRFDSGGASRFFYCAKASKAERNAGLDARTPEIVNDGRETSIDNPYQRGDTLRRNTHPTVKPLALMRYLAKLTKTPTGGVVLDPFAGSGSTLIGAVLEGRRAIGIELEEEYAKICAARVDHHKNT